MFSTGAGASALRGLRLRPVLRLICDADHHVACAATTWMPPGTPPAATSSQGAPTSATASVSPTTYADDRLSSAFGDWSWTEDMYMAVSTDDAVTDIGDV